MKAMMRTLTTREAPSRHRRAIVLPEQLSIKQQVKG